MIKTQLESLRCSKSLRFNSQRLYELRYYITYKLGGHFIFYELLKVTAVSDNFSRLRPEQLTDPADQADQVNRGQ